MGLINSTGERLRRATQLWHTYLATTGQRFELAMFLKDPAIEKQTLDGALASGDLKLIALAQDWLRDTGQAVPAVVAARVVTTAEAPAADPTETRNRRVTCAACVNGRSRATKKNAAQMRGVFIEQETKVLTSRSSDGTSGRYSRWSHHSRTVSLGGSQRLIRSALRTARRRRSRLRSGIGRIRRTLGGSEVRVETAHLLLEVVDIGLQRLQVLAAG